MALLDAGRLAVTGFKISMDRTSVNTFIDLFRFEIDPDSHEKPLLMTSTLYYSKEFTSVEYSLPVCFLHESLFVTCCDGTIKSYDTNNGCLVQQAKIIGVARCINTGDGSVYVGLASNKVIVFDVQFIERKTITLKGLKDSDYPDDITVSNNKLFICTGLSFRRALMCNNDGEIEQEYTNQQYKDAWSITVSEEKGLIFILWCDNCRGGKGVIAIHTLVGGRSFSGVHSTLFGGHILASFKVPDDSMRIRINNNLNRLFVVTWTAGKIYEYHTSDIFNFENLVTSLESLIERDDCRKLLEYFNVTADESKTILGSDAPLTSLIGYLIQTGSVSTEDTNQLQKACTDQGLSKVVAVLTVYQQVQDSKMTKKYLINQLNSLGERRQRLLDKLAKYEDEGQEIVVLKTEEDRMQLIDKLRISEFERQQLTERLKSAEDRYKISEDERKQLTNKLQIKEETLNITQRELKHTSDRLKAEEKEKQTLCDKWKDEEKQLLQRLANLELHQKEVAPNSSRGDNTIKPNSDCEVSEKCLWQLSRKVGVTWMNVGRSLNLTEADLENVKEDHGGQSETSYQMLLLWKRSAGTMATYRVLADALKQAGRADLAGDFFK
ncbi:uncharacterized protein [Apostichopus japonicus]